MRKLNEERVRYVLKEIDMSSSKANKKLRRILLSEFEVEIKDSIVTLISQESKLKVSIAWVIIEMKLNDKYNLKADWEKELDEMGLIQEVRDPLEYDELEYEVTSAMNYLANLSESNDLDLFVVDLIDVIVPFMANVERRLPFFNQEGTESLINMLSVSQMLHYIAISTYLDSNPNNVLKDIIACGELLLVSGVHNSLNAQECVDEDETIEVASIREGVMSYWANSHEDVRCNNESQWENYDTYKTLTDYSKSLDVKAILVTDTDKVNQNLSESSIPIHRDYPYDITKTTIVKIHYGNNRYMGKRMTSKHNIFDDL